MSAAASDADEQAAGPLFSDRTDDTEKTITRYRIPSHEWMNVLLELFIF